MTSRPGQGSLLPRGYFSFPEIAGQNAWLDLLRSAAVLLVLCRHGERAVSAAGGPPASAAGDPLQTLFMNGWVGVDLFLVLSGYLIGKGLIRAFDATSAINVKTYFRARTLRIVPAYVFVLLVTAAGLFPFYALEGDEIARRVLYHLLFLQDYLPADINVVFWSLGVEEKFYLLAPILLYCLLKARKQGHALGLLLALLLLSPCIKLAQFLSAAAAPDYDMFFASFRSPFHLSLEPLVVGVAISYVREKKLISLSPLAGGWLFAVSAAVMSSWLMSHEFLKSITLFDVAVQPLIIALLFGCMVLGATCMGETRCPGERIWRPVSRLSYSLYLVHFPLIPLCLAAASMFLEPAVSFWIIYVAVAFVASAWLHFVVEKPFLILKERGFPARRAPAKSV